MLLRGRCLVLGRPGLGYVVADLDQALAAVLGRPPLDLVVEAVERMRVRDLLVEERGAEYVARALAGWRAEGAVIHAWAGGGFPPGPGVRLLGADDPLAHVPADLRQEIEEARADGPVSVGSAAGLPVSFCYAGSVTETLWDVSIDTLEAHRRRGLARDAFLHMAALQAADGRLPVWGALDSNQASLRLAHSLGFRPVDRLVVFNPPDPANSAPPV